MAARTVAAAGMMGFCLVCAVPTAHASSGFNAGDLVVEQVIPAPSPQSGCSPAAGPNNCADPVQLLDYTTTGTLENTISLPTADSGSTHAVFESGTATYDGEITLSSDDSSILVPGYDDYGGAGEGASGLTSLSPAPPRVIAAVNQAGTIDSSTELTDSTTEGQNFRSAAGANGLAFYGGGGAGIGYGTDGTSSLSYINTGKIHQVALFGGQLYASTTSAIEQIGTGEPTSGTPTVTSFTLTNKPSGFEPTSFVLLNTGGTPTYNGYNVMYVADTTGGTETDPGQVEKYVFTSGTTWTLASSGGDVPIPSVTGLTGSYNSSTGAVTLYATGAPSASANTYATELYSLTDTTPNSSSWGGTTTLTTLVTAPSGDTFKGVAFAPTVAPASTPEVPWTPLLLGIAGAIAGGYVLIERRRKRPLAV